MHTRFFAALSLSVVTLATGCSISPEADSDDPGGPVAASPLAGTINGASFTAKSAIATPSGSTAEKMSLSIYDVDATCDKANPDVDRHILTSVPWKAGTSRDLKLDFGDVAGSQTVTFVVGKSNNIISNSGRIEIIEAPTEKGSTGKIRLRASAQENKVEGEISVTVCPR